jgi:hypothetical protein
MTRKQVVFSVVYVTFSVIAAYMAGPIIISLTS